MPGLRFINVASYDEAVRELNAIGVDSTGVKLMAPKMIHLTLKLDGITCAQANILKQDMLSLGGDAAVHSRAVNFKVDRTDCVLMGTTKQFERLAKKLRIQPFGLKQHALELSKLLHSIKSVPPPLETKKKSFAFGERTFIMGILNVTPDSFSEKGIFFDTDTAVRRGMEMAEAGADIIDIGGESTRPGAEQVSAEEEMKRVIPVIERLAPKISIPISIDTYKAEVAKRAMEAGAEIINDISGLRFDSDMPGVAASSGAAVIIMHIKGTPKEMQLSPTYQSLITEVIGYLEEGIMIAEDAGVQPDRVVIDPGIGFGKTIEHNLTIMKNLEAFKALGKPVLIGTSRKSFIGKITGTEVEERTIGTAATVSIVVLNGADIVRVHDVKEGVQAARMADAIKCANN
ncbi:MAG: Dihydropteroate synthase [Deltaproteobacteria bacterium]|nr:Dihydropteroate synthase [Deltaproteobacteria bacterium]